MLPILIYDFSHNFPQTIKFVIWIGYRILRLFGYPGVHAEDQLISSNSMMLFSFNFYKNLVFAGNNIVAFVILIFSSTVLFINLFRKKMCEVGFVLLALWILISVVGFFANKTPSEAYLPILFPALIFLTAFSFDKVMKIKRFFIPVFLSIIFIVLMNSYFVILSEYSAKSSNFKQRLLIAKEIVKKANGQDYNLVGKGEGSQFESFTMNYKYLTWWLGHSPSKSLKKLKFIIQEKESGAFFKNINNLPD